MPQPQLDGRVEVDEYTRLKREMAGLQKELDEARDEVLVLRQASKDATQAIAALRKQLEPMYNALRMIFGEIDRVKAESVSSDLGSATEQNSAQHAKWEPWKRKLAVREWQVVETLLDHGPMTRPALATALRCHPDTVSQLVGKLKAIIAKQGDKFVLRGE